MTITPISKDAVKLMLQGTLCLSAIETNGIQIDVPYLRKTIKQVQKMIVKLEEQIKSTDEWHLWKSIYKNKAKITSRQQFGTILFGNIENAKKGNLGYTCKIYTKHGAPEVSELSLQDIDLPVCKDYIKYMSFQKVLSTNLNGIADEIDSDGILHPSFNLNTVQTYRSSCVAKGTFVAIKGYSQPAETPIENISTNDYVYCFDNNFNLRLRKVLWAGKTGHKKVIRIYFADDNGKRRYIDLTPEHKIRMADGVYIAAKDAIKYKSKRCHQQSLGVDFQAAYPNYRYTIIGTEEVPDPVDVYDICVDEFHNFIANGVCIKNSDTPNFQNFPARNEELSKLVRRCFIARPGNYFVEIDYSSAEVRCNAAINQDERLIQYVTDPSSDMHKDMAIQIFRLSPEQVTKPIRNISKGGFVFASFYGSFWKGLAEGIWDQVRIQNPETSNGVSLVTHLKSVGLKKLGRINDKGEPEPNSFYAHIKEIETDFWENRFAVYNRWKKDTWAKYLQNGYIETPMGFRCSGVFTRNEILNIPAQSSAFHCLLWSLIQIQKKIKKYNLKTLLVGQIHDSIVADSPPDELDIFLEIAEHIMTKQLRKRWTWLTVPMEVEADVADIGKTWFDKKLYPIKRQYLNVNAEE
jgi:DNA polymerase I-like protein with 3'-5' exonuclease and polymerase domains